MAVSAQNDVRGLRYIDDLVLNRQDSNADGDYIDSGDFTHYALTDHQFSVIALIDSAGNLIERVSYTPYGEARHHWMQDVDGDGDIDATDQSLTTAALNNRIYQGGYNVDADFNRDGLIDSNDSRQVSSGSFAGALPAGWISALNVGNTIGFSGYVFNREIDAGGLYSVRFRHYDPVWGRWTSRDPAGYADGMSLYGYVGSNPINWLDPFGLKKKGFLKGIWDYITGQEDEEWEEMMRRNQEMLKDRIEDQVDRGIRSREDADEFIHGMEEMLRLTLEELDAILLDARITVAIDVAITVIPGGLILRAIRVAGRAVRVAHFTSRANAALIRASGHLRAGTYVTKGWVVIVHHLFGPRAVEWLLRIERGKGEVFFRLKVPGGKLNPAKPGDTTRLRTPQYRLQDNCPISFLEYEASWRLLIPLNPVLYDSEEYCLARAA